MLAKLGMPASYYARRLGAGWLLIVLDTTELSGHAGWPEVAVKYSTLSSVSAACWLMVYPLQGSEMAEACSEYQRTHPLGEQYPHLHTWNGGISAAQLR